MSHRTMRAIGILLLISLILPAAWHRRAEGTAPQRGPSLFGSPVQAMALGNWGKEAAAPLGFAELYSGASSLGIQFSPKLKSLNGKRVSMVGFMAPPLKPTLAFFVLTKVPMAICPFCSTDADWPNDIVVVRLSKPVTALPYDQPIQVTGRLEVGSQIDRETGFVSLVRIIADTLERAK
ncbi:hypothetical protein EDC14_1001227 [Hydrogenispora ethanolica]|uniref:DUF3299 domain-containing protein n=2 Tax=Hydrogenispora ethanolica TaxID=1082276 RepID=A0A4R1SE44_HYDET|nr:hypothetical protein EDC14_1001227 [Hydrogenispora ethanolica]